jgi:glycine oxidase
MVVIIGGGICGLGIGWRLVCAGCAVTIIDRGAAGQAATWAAAGMLAPHAEAKPGEERLSSLLIEGHRRWPDFVRDLEAAAGYSVDYRTEGALLIALDQDDAAQLKFTYDFQRSIGLEVAWLSGYEACQREPHLARTVTAAVFSPHDHQVDNRKVAQALREAFCRAGGVLREHTEVHAILIEQECVRGVQLADETVVADVVVLAAGAWSRNIPGLPATLRPPVRPVKGQMLAVQMPPEAPLLAHVLSAPDAYLVPRADGRLLIGATVEEMGFDTQLTAGGVLDLLRGAWEALPGVYDLPIVEMWAGLRPGSRDGAPILGLTDIQGLIMATGHFRNGILLAPLTAQTISQLILTGTTDDIIAPFGLARFRTER